MWTNCNYVNQTRIEMHRFEFARNVVLHACKKKKNYTFAAISSSNIYIFRQIREITLTRVKKFILRKDIIKSNYRCWIKLNRTTFRCQRAHYYLFFHTVFWWYKTSCHFQNTFGICIVMHFPTRICYSLFSYLVIKYAIWCMLT